MAVGTGVRVAAACSAKETTQQRAGFEIEHRESGGWAVDRNLQRLRCELQAAAGVMHLYFQVLLGERSCSGGEEDRGGRGCMQFFEHSLVLCRACVGAGLRG